MPSIVSVQDADTMFMNTVVEVGSVPVLVCGWGGDHTNMLGINLLNDERMDLPLDAAVLLSPTKHMLGYYQEGGEAVFLQRRPIRQYRVGWGVENVPGMPNLQTSKARRSNFLKMLLKTYPTMKKAYANAVDSGNDMAFDRQFSINSRGDIFYKGNGVGGVIADAIVLDTRFKFLQKELEGLYNV